MCDSAAESNISELFETGIILVAIVMALDDHTMSETLSVLTDLSSVPQMWHVLVGTQRWSKLKAYISLLFFKNTLKSSAQKCILAHFPHPLRLLSSLLRHTFLRFLSPPRPPAVMGCYLDQRENGRHASAVDPLLWSLSELAKIVTCSRSSSIGTCTCVVKRPAGTGELLVVRLMNQSDSSLLCRGRKQVTREVSGRTVCSLWW